MKQGSVRSAYRLVWLAALVVMLGSALPAAAVDHALPSDSRPPGAPLDLPAVSAAPTPPIAPGVALVGLKPSVATQAPGIGAQTSDPDLNRALEAIGARGVEPLFPDAPVAALGAQAAEGYPIDLTRIHRVRLPADADVMGAVRVLEASPAVEFAEPDYLAQQLATPNDPQYAGQWGLPKIGAPAAWDTTTGSPDVVIAVVDSGLDTAHEDFAGRLWTNPGEIAGNGVDDDSNGKVDDIHGWNILNNNANLSDNTGHGTQVAGVLAATANNSKGIAGVCWDCRIMVVKVTQVGGVSNYSDIAAGVVYAAQKGAKVVNLSLGGYADSSTLRAAIAAAAETAVIVAGAGNDNTANPLYPAAYDDYVLAVAGTDNADRKVATSNYGAWVDVSAPGAAITTTFSGGGYGAASGTSLATAFASGLAGLLRSQNPGWSGNMTRAQIVQTTDAIDALNPAHAGQLGSGRINAQKAVNTAATPRLEVASTNAPIRTGATFALVVTLHNRWRDAASVTGALSTTSADVSITKAAAGWGAIHAFQSAGNTGDAFQVFVAAGKYGLTIPFRLNLVADGVSSTLDFTATTESAVVTVGGTLASDTTWTNDRIYQASNVIVNPGVTLTIQPGTTVKFNPGRCLIVRGTLIADGTPASLIHLTKAGDERSGCYYAGEWASVHFTFESQPALFDGGGEYVSGSIMRYCIVEDGQGLRIGSGAAPFINHNLIRRNEGYPLVSHGTSVISHNRIVDNDTYGTAMRTVSLDGGILRQNLIANNFGPGAVQVRSGMVISNTIVYHHQHDNQDPATVVLFQTAQLKGNNIVANDLAYDVLAEQVPGGVVDARANYWGTTSQSAIQARILDSSQEPSLCTAEFVPFLTQPNPDAPPFVHLVSVTPSSPAGIEQVAFDVRFSKPMDQGIDPIVAFGATEPYTQFMVSDNSQWITGQTFRATYDVTSLVARGAYTVSVSGARDVDGMEIPTDTRFRFTVDYAGSITDQTPPNAPSVFASGKVGDPGYVEASYSAHDPESAIILYRYAIGNTVGATDIVNWTNTTGASFARSGLGLVKDRQYWVSVQARNTGGLWSTNGVSPFVAGQKSYRKLYLPVVTKR